MFPKDTIMGRVLNEVSTNEDNRNCMEMVDDLLSDIRTNDYLDYNGPVWSKAGLTISTQNIEASDFFVVDPRWIYIETEYVSEFSWLVYELEDIYQPTAKEAIRLYSTVGYLLEVYSSKYSNLDDILKMTALISVVWLHPDHIKEDQFKVHPINLPDFGKEF